MGSRKGQSATDRKARFDIVLSVLSGNPTPLKVPGLVAVLREAGHEVDDETPKKWGDRGIPEKWARLIALLPRAQAVGLTADWMRDGTAPGPRQRGKTAPALAQGARVREAVEVPDGGRARRGPALGSSELLSAEEIADEVGEVIEPLIRLLAAKGETIAARWLLTVAAEANDQGVTDVRPLIDLARDFLWRAERVE